MRGAFRHGGVALALSIVASACALPRGMEPAAPVASHCPAEAPRVVGQLAAERGVDHHDADLTWYRASADRDRELAARWCETVGGPVVELAPARAAAWTPGQALRVVSWNTWIGGGDVERFLAEELDLHCSETGGVARAVHGTGRGARTVGGPVPPFVLLLQEVWRYSDDLPEVEGSRIVPFTIDPEPAPDDGPDIVEVAERCGLALVYVPSARNGPDTGPRPNEDKGNAVLANVPLTGPLAIDLPLEGGRKVAVGAVVRTPQGQSVRVVSAHLDVASTLVRTVLSGNQTRVRQAMGLVDALDLAQEDGFLADATIVGADMNTWAGNEATLDRMWRAFPDSPEWDGLATRGFFPTDHIFFRSEEASGVELAAYERIADTYSSDHHPRSAVVRYERVE